LKESMSAYRRLEGTYNRLRETTSNGKETPSDLNKAIDSCRKNFVLAMNDDFNTREGIAELFQLARISNNYDASELDSDLLKSLIDTFETYGSNVLGLFSSEIIAGSLEDEIESLISDRNSAREAKDWSKSDSIRDKLQDMGIEIQDTPDGTKWRRV